MNNLFAFYGSLRFGLSNHQTFAPFLKYRFSTWIDGYAMYSLGEFPFAVRTQHLQDKILVEVFEIESNEVRGQIDQLELSYGYHKETILVNELPTSIYLFREKANYPQVIVGDWVKFYRGEKS